MTGVDELLASLSLGVLVADEALRVVWANLRLCQTLDVDGCETLVRRDIEELIPSAELRRRAAGVLGGEPPAYGLETQVGAKQLRLSVGLMPETGDERLQGKVLIGVEELTEQRQLQVQARLHTQRLNDLARTLAAIVWEADATSLAFSFMSRHVEALLGYPAARWLASPQFWPEVIHPDDRRRVVELYRQACQGDTHQQLQYRALTSAGRTVWLHDTVQMVCDPDGGGRRLRGVMIDITERKDTEQRLLHLTHHDAVTNLPNRRLLRGYVTKALAQATHRGRCVAMLLIELDRFQFINKTLGPEFRDRLLRQVGERLRRCVHDGDLTACLGGDVFALLSERLAQPRDAGQVAEKIIANFARPFELDGARNGRRFFFSASIGISVYPGDGEDADALLKHADNAMHRAKERGGNQYQFFAPEMNTTVHKHMDLEHAPRNAVAGEEFVLYYQPQIDIASGHVVSSEALPCWQHPQGGLVSPCEFIPLLEETEFIVRVGKWVLRQACTQHRLWREAGLAVGRLAVNLSAQQIHDRRFPENLVQVLQETQMPPEDLELEIAESAVMQETQTSMAVLHEIRALGVELSMDDFGTGYSSLSCLKRLPLQAVKIDRSFVSNIPGGENDVAIARAAIALGHTLGLRVVGEGVETREQLEFLTQHGCGIAQGHLFSPPLPPRRLAQLFERAPGAAREDDGPNRDGAHRHSFGSLL